jgi:hypothetical protein
VDRRRSRSTPAAIGAVGTVLAALVVLAGVAGSAERSVAGHTATEPSGPWTLAAQVQPAPPAAPTQADEVKYYVVGSAGNGEREFLFGIAARTLGNGNRYEEIFRLNAGRVQPDGGRLEDPLVLKPGWILLLPDDAQGPGVRVGPRSSIASSVTVIQPTAKPTAPDSGSDGLARLALFLVVVVILGTALHLLRADRRLALPSSLRSTAVRRLRRLKEMVEVTRGWADTLDPSDRATGPDRPDSVDQPAAPSRATKATHPLLVDPTTARVETVVRSGDDVLAVRLIGGRPGFDGAFAWRGARPALLPGGVVVTLGDQGPDGLHLDLAVSPDVISIGGDPAGVRRVVRSLARQLSAAKLSTIAVGDATEVDDLAGRRAGSVADLVDGARESPVVAFIGELRTIDVPAIHHLVSQRQPRVIPVVTGSGPEARWSIMVGSRTEDHPEVPAERPLTTLG